MAKTNQAQAGETAKTAVELFLDQRVEKGKLTREQANAILAKRSADLTRLAQKFTAYQGRNIKDFTTAEQRGLLIVLAYVCGISDINGTIL